MGHIEKLNRILTNFRELTDELDFAEYLALIGTGTDYWCAKQGVDPKEILKMMAEVSASINAELGAAKP